ncbi:hypothetical protein ACM3BL_13670 [Mammaliicoccus sciuri]
MTLINSNMTLLKYADDSAYRFQIEYLDRINRLYQPLYPLSY